MEKRNQLKAMIIGNLILIQLQAIVVGFLASILSLVMGWIPQGIVNLRHALVLCSSSVLTASITSFLLGSFVCFYFIFNKKKNEKLHLIIYQD